MPDEDESIEATAEEAAEETTEEIIEETVTIGDVMDAVRALDERISAIAAEIADIKSMRIESGAEFTDTETGEIGDVDDDPEPRSIDELDFII